MTLGSQRDDYLFTGFDDGWFSNCFEPSLGRFGFIGARDRLLQLKEEKGFRRKIFEAFSKEVKLAPILSVITAQVGLSLPSDSGPNRIAEAIFQAMDEANSKRTIEQYLDDTQKSCSKSGRYFDSVSTFEGVGKATLWGANRASLEDHIVVVCGQLVHKDAIGQYDDLTAQTVKKLTGNWLITDYPPHAMVSQNENFKGHAIALTIEESFARLFESYLPYRAEYGWYPYVRVTGFFREPGFSESLPSLEVIMTEFRRPKLYQDSGSAFFSFLYRELDHAIFLEERSNLLIASYILPFLAASSGIDSFKVPPEEKKILEAYRSVAGADLPNGLNDWYTRALA